MCKRLLFGLGIGIWLLAWLAAGAGGGTTTAVSAADGFVIDHMTVDAAEIPQAWLDEARQLDVFFAHKSVGNNILDGMADLQANDPLRYTLVVATDGLEWYDQHDGLLHRSLGSNTLPQTKIDGFDAFIRSGFSAAVVGMMKFCPGDTLPFGEMPAAEIWAGYRNMMQALEADFPGTTFVWWTMPLATSEDNRGNAEKTIFNTAVRSYCAANDCVLFDIAAIESHDPAGNSIFSATGDEAMWPDYASDGAHLNEVGRQRVAQAMWWLLARLAGWPGPVAALTLTASPAQHTVWQGGTAVFEVALTGAELPAEPITLAVSGLPPGSSAVWQPPELMPPGTAVLSVTIDTSTPYQDYTLHIDGLVDEAVVAQTTAVLQVRWFTFVPLIAKFFF